MGMPASGFSLQAICREIKNSILDRSADDFNASQIPCSEAHIFRKAQRAVAALERLRAPVCLWIKTHESHADRVGGYGIRAGHKQARARNAQ